MSTFYIILFLSLGVLYIIKEELFDIIANYLIKKSFATPYFHLEGYMERYWLVPYKETGSATKIGCGPVTFLTRPIAWVLQYFGIAVRVHKILRRDDDRTFHNHTWNFVSVILKNGYIEKTPVYDSNDFYTGINEQSYPKGSVIFRKDSDFHMLKLIDKKPTWTLFITGPDKRKWGFLTHARNIVPWDEYIGAYKEEGKDEK